MHYYKFHIGDYARDTSHLTVVEHGIYRLLLDWCYLNEKPITTERAMRVGRGYPEETQSVLSEFFLQTDEGWIHARVVSEVEDYHAKAEKNRENGAKGGRKKSENNPVGSQSGSETNPNQEPLTTNQEPIFKEANASLSATRLPDCPHKEILNLFAKHLPQLTQPRLWEGSRAQNLRARWLQCSKPSSFNEEGYTSLEDGLKFWDSFFAYIAKDTKLASGFESNGRSWKPDLPWIVNAANFAKIIDGKYDV